MRNIQIGGRFTCRKCGEYCSGADVHECPEDIKQTRLTDVKKGILDTRELRKKLKKKGLLFDTK